jgi:LysM repeat protein
MKTFVLVFYFTFAMSLQANALILPKKPIQKVQVKEGQTVYSIAKEHGLTLRQIHQYNQLDSQADYLATGSWIYLQKHSTHVGASPDKQPKKGE